jgi:tetratricopeptide (TPR) repeat protein
MLHNRRGDSYRLASDYRAASSDYKDAITITEQSLEIPYLKELGRARLGLAKLARLKADYIQARRYYGDAHEAFEECRDQQGMIETEYGIGEVSRLVCHWQESRQAYSASLERAKKTGNAERKAYALWGLGEVQRLTEDYAAAENSHEEGLQGCREVNDTRSEGWALLGLAETHRAIGALVKSRAFYEKAEERFVRTHSDTEIAHATLGRCEAERAEGRFHFDQYAVAERTYRDKELRHCLLLCLTAKAAALRLNDKEREAAECLDEARQLALAVGLEHELSIISSMQADPASAPPLPLNFP